MLEKKKSNTEDVQIKPARKSSDRGHNLLKLEPIDPIKNRRASSPFNISNLKFTLRPTISKMVESIHQTNVTRADSNKSEDYIKQLMKEFETERLINTTGVKPSHTQIKLLNNSLTFGVDLKENDEHLHLYKSNIDLKQIGKKRESKKNNISVDNININIDKEKVDINKNDIFIDNETKSQINKSDILNDTVITIAPLNNSEITSVNTSTVSRFKPKKRGLKELFGMAIKTDTEKKPQPKIGKLFAKLAINKPKPRSSKAISVNEFNDIMDKLDKEENNLEIKDNNNCDFFSQKLLDVKKTGNYVLISSIKNKSLNDELKEDLKKETKNLFIKIAIDESPSDYSGQTLFFRNDSEVNSPINIKRRSKRETEYFKHLLKMSNSNILAETNDYIEAEMDYQFIDDENNCKIFHNI